jgi:hypothetical protein
MTDHPRNASQLWRVVLSSTLIGTLLGLLILGGGGRGVMRTIAHWEGRVPVFTVSGTLTILLVATLGGLAAGIVHGLLTKFISSHAVRVVVFLALCIVFTWYAEIELLPRPRMMFIGLIVVYAIVLDVLTALYRPVSVAGHDEERSAIEVIDRA